MKIPSASVIGVAAALMFAAAGCGNGNIHKRELRELDKALAGQSLCFGEFEKKLDVRRRKFEKASGDSLKWEYARRLYNGYHHYNQDSVAKYQRMLMKYATTPEQRFYAGISRVRMYVAANDLDMAESLFNEVDTSGLRGPEFFNDWLQCKLYLNSSLAETADGDEKAEYRQKVKDIRESYMRIDSTSFYARRMAAQYARDEGDSLKALDLLRKMYDEFNDEHHRASTAYNISKIYEGAGDSDNRFSWLVRSAIHDFRNPERAYLSLYEIAVILYGQKQYRKAEQYINKNLVDIMEGNFSYRFYNSSQAQLIITAASREASRVRIRWLAAVICVVTAMLAVIFILFRRQVKLGKRLNEVNRRLTDANKINSGYVFRYMALSVHYIDRIADTRNEIRSLARSGGSEAVLKALKSPAVMYKEYDDYYHIFDETFLGLYPDFIVKVNELLSPEARFQTEGVKELPTDLRILAAIRIGINESGKIARFLKCSPNTVYTYRTRLKRLATCPKDEFESRIMQI